MQLKIHMIDKLKNLPSSPGIYQYFDKDGRLLYIGKAKVLKNRVKSYFNFTPTLSPSSKLSPRIYKMISETKDIQYLVVESEHDALILENSLIKQLKPKYNILLRDDKTYPYIYIDLNEDFPRFEITRKVIKRANIRYFGPFSTGARATIDSIYEIFPLVQKKSCIKTQKKCLFYQIGRCLAPCEGLVSKDEYKKLIDSAMKLLLNKKLLTQKIEESMTGYAENLQFEEAGKLRDKMNAIKNSMTLSHIDLAKLNDFDVFAVEIDGNKACGIKLFIREGRVVSSDHTIFKNQYGFDKDELYHILILNHYKQELPFVPKEILTFEDFASSKELKELILQINSKNITFKTPIKGDKKNLTSLAHKNAIELLRMQNKTDEKILHDMKELFNLSEIPYTIEGYDNSHMMGVATVGAVVRWEEKFVKSSYRHYNLSAKDEYAQMNELISRRIEDLEKNPLPDLLVLDGGATLLKLALKIVKQKNLFVDIIAIAKEKRDNKAQRAKSRAKDIIYTKDGEFHLSVDDKRLHFIQNMRDEAHRFVISFHQKQKRKDDSAISLLGKKGIGEATVKKLIQYFETFENINKASKDEIKEVVGVKIANILKT